MQLQKSGHLAPSPIKLSTDARPVPTPTHVGRTTLPKVPLSYRWVISDAEVFLMNCSNFKSPMVLVLLPDQKESHWQLVLSKEFSTGISVYLSNAGPPPFQIAPGMVRAAKKGPSLVISKCTLSVISSSAGQSKRTAVLPDKVYMLNESLKNFGVPNFIKDLSDYLEDGALTIQVDATLHCYSTPSHSLDKLATTPLDNIRQSIEGMYKNDNALADITFRCASIELKAHKVILASQSPVFRKMFEVDMKEKKSEIVEIFDFTPEVLSNLLSYFYAGTCPDMQVLAKELLNAANKYQLPSLMAMCERELETQVKKDNVFEYLVLAYLHQAHHLKASCMRFIKTYPAVFESEDWKSFKQTANNSLDCQDLLIEIVQLDKLPTPKPSQDYWDKQLSYIWTVLRLVTMLLKKVLF